jgi:hypothetical protein
MEVQILAAAAAGALAAVALALVEQRPDFSGEWVLDRAACTLSPGADGMESAVLHIEHAEPTFRVTARFVGKDGKAMEFSFDRVSDGRAVVTGDDTSSLRWDGDALVVTDETKRPDFEFRMSWRYELIDAGRRLKATEWIRATNHNQDNIWVFDRP